MRLWTLHPRYLDAAGLTACWREGLLAQKVLQGGTKGYTAHPQLARFRATPDPLAAVAAYLSAVHAEATERGYRFDAAKIGAVELEREAVPSIPATTGQLAHEWSHLLAKLRARDPRRYDALLIVAAPEPHPLFTLEDGPVADWERGASAAGS